RVLGAPKEYSVFVQYRNIGDNYESILNCPDDAFVTAVRTLAAREQRYGASNVDIVRDWTRAQVAVFSNCPSPEVRTNPAPNTLEPVLPDPAPPDADPLVRADRGYQTAAAYFYGLRYEEAARRFREIAADPTSPWRIYGRYLAARATLRRATVEATNDADRD